MCSAISWSKARMASSRNAICSSENRIHWRCIALIRCPSMAPPESGLRCWRRTCGFGPALPHWQGHIGRTRFINGACATITQNVLTPGRCYYAANARSMHPSFFIFYGWPARPCGAVPRSSAARSLFRQPLEDHPQRQLDNARRLGAVDDPKVRVSESVARDIEIREVEYIEKFAAKLSLHAFRHGEVLGRAQVDVAAARSAQHGSWRVAELKIRGMREGRVIEVVLQRAPGAEPRVANQI